MDKRTTIIVNLFMAGVFIALVTIMFTLSGQAKQYNSFCRENDFNYGGYWRPGFNNKELACLRPVDENLVEFRLIDCANGCRFTSELKEHYPKSDPDANSLMIDLEGGQIWIENREK